MNKVVIALLILIVLIIIVICLFFISRYKKQAIQVFTISSFLNDHHLNENENQKKSLIDRINDFFDDKGNNDSIDNGKSDDGDDSGE
ncbi:hypothetical protein [Bacillus sp. EAC]|uniref:hypothetical protein n=1 Tax=Bacillus sp. EAC TaxID=1978338 RepID=UPI00211B3386|nr:hypothetical protein [Bacillus sp. EAC]